MAASSDKRGYTYDVVSVQATFEESKAGIYDRWQEGRAEFERGESQLGGRPVPSDFANNLITPDGKSVTEESAKWLSEHGEGVVIFGNAGASLSGSLCKPLVTSVIQGS